MSRHYSQGTVDFVATCGDVDPCAAVDCAEGYECVDGDCVLMSASPWNVYITGSNHTIVIDGSAVIDLGGTNLEAGDVLVCSLQMIMETCNVLDKQLGQVLTVGLQPKEMIQPQMNWMDLFQDLNLYGWFGMHQRVLKLCSSHL